MAEVSATPRLRRRAPSRRAAEGARAIGCDASYVALPLLTALAAARRIALKRGWAEPAIVWTAIVGESGKAKLPALELALRPVRERQRDAMRRHAEATRAHEGALAGWFSFDRYAGGKGGGDRQPDRALRAAGVRLGDAVRAGRGPSVLGGARAGPQTNPAPSVFVMASDVRRVIDAAPDAEWRR